jgi:hypothetical protein
LLYKIKKPPSEEDGFCLKELITLVALTKVFEGKRGQIIWPILLNNS